MKLSIWSNYYGKFSPEEAVLRFIKNGIFASELSDEHGEILLNRDCDVVKTGKEFSKFLKENNFEMSQGHLWLRIKICDEGSLEKLYKWVDLYEAIGIKNMVLHCDELLDQGFSLEERKEKNIEVLKKLADYLKGRNITICLENLRTRTISSETSIVETVDDILYLIKALESENFGICLDTGHLNLTVKNQREFILKAGSKLKAIHIADNCGVNDEHKMPFNGGSVDFIEVVKALKEIDYKGLFNLEIPGESWQPLELCDSKINYIKDSYNYLMNNC